MKQYLSDEQVKLFDIYYKFRILDNYVLVQVAEIDEILEMKITHRKNLERRKAKLGYINCRFFKIIIL